jgi:antitoxin MazE
MVLTAKKKRPREGWAEAAAAIVAAGEDGLVWPKFGNEDDEDLI